MSAEDQLPKTELQWLRATEINEFIANGDSLLKQVEELQGKNITCQRIITMMKEEKHQIEGYEFGGKLITYKGAVFLPKVPAA